MSEIERSVADVSRREVIKKGLRIGGAAYAVPAVVMALKPVSALAAVTGVPTPGGTTQPCNAATQSGGVGVTTTNHELGRTSGTFVFTWEAYSIPDKFEVFYQGATLFTTGGFVSGPGSRSISYSGSATFVTVVVTGSSSGTDWDYTVSCPTANT